MIAHTLTIGDFVMIGKSRLTWEVIGLGMPGFPSRWATLRSGQTGRKRLEATERLTLFRKGKS